MPVMIKPIGFISRARPRNNTARPAIVSPRSSAPPSTAPSRTKRPAHSVAVVVPMPNRRSMVVIGPSLSSITERTNSKRPDNIRNERAAEFANVLSRFRPRRTPSDPALNATNRATPFMMLPTKPRFSLAQLAKPITMGEMSRSKSFTAGSTALPITMPSSDKLFFRRPNWFPVVSRRAPNSRSMLPRKPSLPPLPFFCSVSMLSV